MTPSLTNQPIKTTYNGVLHTGGEEIPPTGQVSVFDGNGNDTPIKIGRSGNGISFTGPVKIGELEYAATPNTIGSVMIQTGSNKLELEPISVLYSDLVNLIFPVGSIYLSVESVNPALRFANTVWELVSNGQFLVGVGTGTDSNGRSVGFEVGSNYGEYQHTLTTSEIPTHTHFTCNGDATRANISSTTIVAAGGIANDGGADEDYFLVGSTTPADRGLTSSVGANQTHNNIPPNYGIYIWKRVL